MAAVRGAAGGYLDAWRRGDAPTRLVLAAAGVVGAILIGAFLFGAWHIVVGGVVKGNPRAAAFGVGLSAVTGVLLLVLRTVARRTTLPPPPAD